MSHKRPLARLAAIAFACTAWYVTEQPAKAFDDHDACIIACAAGGSVCNFGCGSISDPYWRFLCGVGCDVGASECSDNCPMVQPQGPPQN